MIKKTRKLIVLTGALAYIVPLFEQLQFKGLTYLKSTELTEEKIMKVFGNNKSVLCTGEVPERFREEAVIVSVIKWRTREWIPEVNLGINVAREDVVEQFERIAKELKIDIGDHIVKDSNANGVTSTDNCTFCNYIKGVGMDCVQRIIYKSKHFFVIPTIGQFTLGYLLIIPNRHVKSFAELNNEEKTEFLEVLADVKLILKLTYGVDKFYVWENGNGDKENDSLVHAHMHIAPSQVGHQIEIEKALKTNFTPIDFVDLSKYGDHSYLLEECEDGTWKINDDPDLYIPRQYVRQLIAPEYGFQDDESWDMLKKPFWENIEQTLVDIHDSLQYTKAFIPKRIIDRTCSFFGI